MQSAMPRYLFFIKHWKKSNKIHTVDTLYLFPKSYATATMHLARTWKSGIFSKNVKSSLHFFGTFNIKPLPVIEEN
jgi:hypothetical protein